jgi:GT2 family glycosyltransferase
MTFAILIPIYNRLAVTRLGLLSLYEALDRYKRSGSNTCRFEVVVIDDGSTDGSSPWITANYPDIHLLHGDGNLWWSGAINKGADYAIDQLKADYLLLWNDDILPATDYFLVAERLFADPGLQGTIIGTKILVKEIRDKVWSIGGFFDRLSGRYGLYTETGAGRTGTGQSDAGNGQGTGVGDSQSRFFDCDWQPGMGTFVPTRLMRQHQLRWDDAIFPQYHGDSDFTMRCKKKGIPVKTCLDLVLYNSSSTSGLGKITDLRKLRLSLVSLRSNYNVRKRFLFYNRHGIVPFSYLGIGKTYFFFFGSFVKRNYLKRPSKQQQAELAAADAPQTLNQSL